MGSSSFSATLGAIDGECLGIFGAGHLGRAIGMGLLGQGFPSFRLLLCHRGAEATRRAIVEAGLSHCLATPAALCRRSRIVIVTLRPQERGVLSSSPLRSDALIVSSVAATPLSTVAPQARRRVRIMPSAPYTIARRSGIVGVYPASEPELDELFRALGLAPLEIEQEDSFHAFTALGACLPIALASWESRGGEVDELALLRLAEKEGLHPYEPIVSWARAARPIEADGAAGASLASAATSGGVTEAILRAIDGGASLIDALRAGIGRSRELEGEAC